MNASPNQKSAAVFLDRDGTLMRDVDYCGDPKEVEIFPGVGEALLKLKDGGYKLIVITNQSGIGRGLFNEEQYRAVEQEVSRQLGQGVIEATYFCPHLPEAGCKCRKPSPELILASARDHEIDLARSYFVGDKQTDIECGRNAGVQTILVRTGYGSKAAERLADFVAEDFKEAATWILQKDAG